MNGKQYFKNQLPVILINFLGILALALFLLANGNNIQSILLITGVWITVLTGYLITVYLRRNQYLTKLRNMTEQLEERYLIPEVMKVPKQAEEQVFYEILKMAEKSMLEKIEEVQRERKEYKEYIEQWIHEIKTPITAMKLLCENHHLSFTRDMLLEVESVNRYTEQALYYARSKHVEKDYCIREVNLEDIVHGAIAENKYLLRQTGMAVTVDKMENRVYTDEKWVQFILNQIIANSVKYRSTHPTLHFSTAKKDNQIFLIIEDNGIGISREDLPRIFEKGFTGENGRTVQNSTGIGLYLCKRLCKKLGIDLTAYSKEKGTTMVLSFLVHDFITGVQG